MSVRTVFAAVVAVSAASACASRPATAPTEASSSALAADIVPSADANGDRSPDVSGMSRVVSNGGSFIVHHRAVPERIPMNEVFGIELVIETPAGRRAPIHVTADAAMPHHGHGMNHLPSVTRRQDGVYVVRDMLLHMSGYWELYVDVECGGITERAQWSIELE